MFVRAPHGLIYGILFIDLYTVTTVTVGKQLLNWQVGPVNFEPLKDQFLPIFLAGRAILRGNKGMLLTTLLVHRNQGRPKKGLLVLTKNFQAPTSNKVQEAYKAATSNKITEARTLFRRILHSILLSIVTQASEDGVTDIDNQYR
ncbi:hypothetical protein EC957_003289 [Mortierella hygrophila]|uniref:Coatomer alpha subunit C-terminal domain-containing protein n=1 Tax=Mortierella hygrophila TaxID=979708 RepID=A0A9P6K139_9FUNG|nr:hypothetical protein EC957_003289 [Mortierella hygrophila]